MASATTGRRRGGRGARALSEGVIVQAALRICDTEGLDQLTVRRLAAELDVGTMTLYSYFRGKDEILDALADHVLGGMPIPPTDPGDRAAVIRTLGHALLDLMCKHPSVAQLLGMRVTMSAHSLRGGMEAVIARMVEAGIPGPDAVRCYGFLITYAIGFAQYQAVRPWGQDAEDELRRQRGHFYASLPAGDFPHMVGLADELVGLPSRAQFDYGLDTYIRGLNP